MPLLEVFVPVSGPIDTVVLLACSCLHLQAAQCLQHIDKAELEAHCQQQPQKRKPQQPEQHATLVGPNTPDASSGRQHFVSDSLPSRLCKSSNLAGLQQSGGTQEAGLGDTAAAEYLLQQQAEACSSDVSIADDSFSSCSSSSNSSCFSSCHGSKGSTASSTSSGAAWQGRMNWSKVFDAPGVSVNGLHHKLSSPDRCGLYMCTSAAWLRNQAPRVLWLVSQNPLLLL